MKTLAYPLFAALILAACTPAPAPTTAPEPAPAAAPPTASVSSSCPNLTLSATPGTPPSRELTIAATVTNPPAGVTYNWSVSAGAISAGQGTASITVDPPTGEPVTATVEVGGAPTSCYGSATIEIP